MTHREVEPAVGRGGPAQQIAVPVVRLAGSLTTFARRELRAVADAPLVDWPLQAGKRALRMLDAGLRPSSSVLDPVGYQQHLLFSDPTSELSVEWLTWHGGSATPIHGHRCWCVVAVANWARAISTSPVRVNSGSRIVDRSSSHRPMGE